MNYLLIAILVLGLLLIIGLGVRLFSNYDEICSNSSCSAIRETGRCPYDMMRSCNGCECNKGEVK